MLNRLFVILFIAIHLQSSAESIQHDSLKNPVGNIRINYPHQILELRQKYPNMDSIHGDLTFSAILGDSAKVDLSFFKQLRYLGGDFIINYNTIPSFKNFENCVFSKEITLSRSAITDLDFLNSTTSLKRLVIRDCDSLKEVGKVNKLKKVNDLTIQGCNKIESININTIIGLLKISSLQELKNVSIKKNDSLSITISYNNLLESIDLDTFLGSIYSLKISDNENLEKVSNLDKIDSIIYGFEFINNLKILNLQFTALRFASYFYLIESNIENLSMTKLSHCRSFDIRNNKNLKNISKTNFWIESDRFEIENCDALENLDFINDDFIVKDRIYIANNDSISTCDVPFICNNISNTDFIFIRNNGENCKNEIDIGKLCGYTSKCPNSSFSLHSDYDVNLWNENYSECEELKGGLRVTNNFSLKPNFQKLKKVNYDISISNTNLKSVDFPALQQLYRISITDNNLLESVFFPSLDSIEAIHISDNNILRQINLTSNIDSMKIKSLLIQGNEELDSIFGLRGFNFCEGLSIRENKNLSYVEFLNYDFTFDRLNIISNKSFKSCDSKAICSHIAENKPYTIEFNDILSCNDSLDVIEGCEKVLSTNLVNVPSVFVYPNPVSDLLNIVSNTNLTFDFKIRNSIAQVILEGKEINQIDISFLPKGIYFIELFGFGFKTSSKFLKI